MSKATGKKQKKDCISVLFGASASGSEKPPLYREVCKFQVLQEHLCTVNTGRNLLQQLQSLQLFAVTFEENVTRFMDRKLSAKGHHVAFVVDDCSTRGAIQNLQTIKIVFLPPNTTAVS